MEASWDICLHITIALASVGLTLTWEHLRQHSRTIDSISKQTQYLTTMTYWTMLRLWKRMDSLEEEVQAIQIEGPDEEDEEKEHETRTPPSTNVYTWDFESNPFATTFTNGYPWTMHDAPWTTSSYTPESMLDKGVGSVGDNGGEVECSDFTDEDEDENSEEGSVSDEDSSGKSVRDNVGTDDSW